MPLEKSNIYNTIPYYFPTTSLLLSTNTLSNTLVGRVYKDIPSVITTKDYILRDPITIDI